MYYDTIVGDEIDTIVVTKLTVNALPNVNLGEDKTLMKPNTLYLNAGFGFKTYSWSTDETDQVITINSAGETATEREYWVVVTDNIGCANSDTIVITFAETSGINSKNEKSESVKVYPNPTSGKINIAFENSYEDLSVKIISESGQIIFNKHFNSVSKNSVEHLDLSEYSSGNYYIIISNEENIYKEPFILLK